MLCVNCIEPSSYRICGHCLLIGPQKPLNVTLFQNGVQQTNESTREVFRLMLSMSLKDDTDAVKGLCDISKEFHNICQNTTYVVRTILTNPSRFYKIVDLELKGLVEITAYVKAVRFWKRPTIHFSNELTWSLPTFLIAVGAFSLADKILAQWSDFIEWTDYHKLRAIYLNGTMEAYNRYNGKFLKKPVGDTLDRIAVIGKYADLLNTNPDQIDFTSISKYAIVHPLNALLVTNRDNYPVLDAFVKLMGPNLPRLKGSILDCAMTWTDKEKMKLYLQHLDPSLTDEKLSTRLPMKLHEPIWLSQWIPISDLQ